MSRRSHTYYIEVYRQNGEEHLHFSRGLLDREHLSDATIKVFMVRDCSTQEEALAKLLKAATLDSGPNAVYSYSRIM